MKQIHDCLVLSRGFDTGKLWQFLSVSVRMLVGKRFSEMVGLHKYSTAKEN